MLTECKEKIFTTVRTGRRAEAVSLAVNPEFTVLMDVYGSILTQKERDMMEYYYNDDLSLREISDNENIARRERREAGETAYRENDTISRQGVRDTIKRAEAKLLSMEEKLGLVRKNREMSDIIAEIRKNAEIAARRAYQARAPKEIITAASEIDTLAEKLQEYL